MDDLRSLLHQTADHVAAFRATIGDRPVRPEADLDSLRKAFGGPLPDHPTAPDRVIEELKAAAEGGLMGSAGPRFFGFVIGGALPAATAADILTTGWDQNAFNALTSPAAWAAEDAAGRWVKELLGIADTASVGFVTGAQAANTAGLAAARHHMLAQQGWDVELKGLFQAPPVRVLANAERHATIDRALRLLGFGSQALEPVGTDRNGAIDIAELGQRLKGEPAIVVVQAGNVNTGAFDDFRAACEIVHASGGWVHVDGAFGLWAAANPATRHLVDGVELADSWGCDAHKWLNVPYDSAFALCSRPGVHLAAMSYTASYLVGSGRHPGAADLTAESSRRARGFAVWAALRELGRDGVAELVERCCALARRFATGLADRGFEIGNDVVLNQVLVSFGDDERTGRVIDAVQREGVCWFGGTAYRGRRFMRISVSNYATTEADVDASIDSIVRATLGA